MAKPLAVVGLVVEETGADPAADPNTIKIYSLDVAGVTQLFARASDGTITQLTPGGGGGVYSPPELWAQNPININQTNKPLNTQVSTMHDEWVALVDGSIVRLGVRFVDAISAGQATIIVSINGVADPTLQLVCDSGSNPTGGIATVAQGDVPYSAGDLIGVMITTNGAFAPTDNGVEAQLQVQDD